MPVRTLKQRGHGHPRVSVRMWVSTWGGGRELHFRSCLVLPNSSFCHKRKSSALMVQSDTADPKRRLFFAFCKERNHIRRPLRKKYSYQETQKLCTIFSWPFHMCYNTLL